MSYEQDLQQQADELAAKQFENDSRTGWLHILRLYPKLSDHHANFKAVQDYAHPFPVSVGIFQQMIDNPRAAATLDLKDNRQRIFSDLVEEICSLLKSPNADGRGGRYSEIQLANERKRLQTFTKDQLVQRRDSIIEAQRLQKMSVSQIKTELTANQPTPQAKVLPAEYTRERIHALPSGEIRKLIRQFSASTVNDRLFGRS